jgi:hypothetical protein
MATYKHLEGKYKAKVTKATFETIGKTTEYPVMKIHFKPVGPYVGNDVQPEEGIPEQNQLYFLSLDIVDKGKYAGKSKLEVLRAEMEEIYGYKGDLDEDAINTHITASERFVDIVCEIQERDGKKFTRVKYVNPVGGAGAGKKPIKALGKDALAAFNKHWTTGEAKPVADAASLFAKLVGGDKK